MIVNADDFGKSKSVNDAIDFCFENQLIDRATLMVNMPECESAIILAKRNGYLDKIGLHLNLVEGEPLLEETKSSSLCKNGIFDMSILNRKYHFYVPKRIKIIIENEVDAQIKKFLNLGCTLKHLDSHRHVHERLAIFLIIKKILRKHHFSSVRIMRNVDFKKKYNLFKKIYLWIFNNFVIGHLFNHNKHLCSMFDVQAGFNKVSAEVMVHPDFINNELYDLTDHRIFDKEEFYAIFDNRSNI